MNEKEMRTRIEKDTVTMAEMQKLIGELSAAINAPYGEVTVTAPENAFVNPSRFNPAAKSTIVCNATVAVPLLALTIKAAVYMSLESKSDGTEITTEPSISTKVFGRYGEKFDGKGLLKSHILAAVESWRGWEAAEAGAIARLSGEVAKKAEQPVRLVKRVALKAPAAAGAAA